MFNMYPIYLFSNNQTSVETSAFGSEYVTLKQGCEYIRGLRYNLRMKGIPVEESTFMNLDNQSVVINASLLYSMLKKKINSIASFFGEGGAKDEWRCGRVGTDDDPSDLITKSSFTAENCIKKVRMLMYDI